MVAPSYCIVEFWVADPDNGFVYFADSHSLSHFSWSNTRIDILKINWEESYRKYSQYIRHLDVNYFLYIFTILSLWQPTPKPIVYSCLICVKKYFDNNRLQTRHVFNLSLLLFWILVVTTYITVIEASIRSTLCQWPKLQYIKNLWYNHNKTNHSSNIP